MGPGGPKTSSAGSPAGKNAASKGEHAQGSEKGSKEPAKREPGSPASTDPKHEKQDENRKPETKKQPEHEKQQNQKYFAICDPTAKALDLSSFIVCIFHSDKGLSSTPSLGAADTAGSSLHYVGKGGMSVVDVKSTGDFRKAVAKTPDENYAWAIIGELKVKEAGAYNLCIESDDGCVAACREDRGVLATSGP